MSRDKKSEADERVPREPATHSDEETRPGTDDVKSNPPHTKTGPFVAPKFGSAGSGGAEYEPGLPRP
jgi:hypothetical protein